MSKLLPMITAAAVALGASISSAATHEDADRPKAEIGYIELNNDITVRQMVIRNPQSNGVVLFLHGFPETLHTWEAVAASLADNMKSAHLIGQAMVSPRGHRQPNSLTRPATTRAS